MNRNKFIAVASAVALALGGCGEDPAPAIFIPEVQREVNIGAADTAFTVEVEHNVEVEVAISEEGNASWLAQDGAAEGAAYTFRAAANPDTAPRKAAITFANAAGGLSQTVEVTQAGAAPAIAAGVAKVELAAADTAFAVEVEHNVEVEVTISEEAAEWLAQEVETRAMQARAYTFHAAANPGADPRKATIAFADEAGTACDTVEVVQAGGKPEDEVYIPDDMFRNYCMQFDKNPKDGKLTRKEAAEVAQIKVSNMGIKSLEGIEYFTALKTLVCYANQLTSLDVRNNTELADLQCGDNRLASLDVRNNAKLASLTCYANQLTSLDVTRNAELTKLTCAKNRLASLDVRNNTKLKTLECYANQLASLDVSRCTELTTLNCKDNRLASLEVSGCKALTSLNCNGNQLANLNVNSCTALTTLYYSQNPSTSLDVSGCKALASLYCSENQLASLNVSGCKALTTLFCYKNRLESLDVRSNTKLDRLYCYENLLDSLDVGGNAALTKLLCYKNLLASLDVSKTNLGYTDKTNTLDCAPMNHASGKNILGTLILKEGWSIKGINNDPSEEYVPKETVIVYH